MGERVRGWFGAGIAIGLTGSTSWVLGRRSSVFSRAWRTATSRHRCVSPA